MWLAFERAFASRLREAADADARDVDVDDVHQVYRTVLGWKRHGLIRPTESPKLPG